MSTVQVGCERGTFTPDAYRRHIYFDVTCSTECDEGPKTSVLQKKRMSVKREVAAAGVCQWIDAPERL